MDVVSPDQDKGPFFWGEHGHSIEFYSSDCVLLATIPRCPVAYLGGGFYFLNGEIEDTITNFTGIEKTFENGCFPQGFFAAGRLSVLDEGLNQCVVLDSSLSEIALVPNGICKREDISRVHPFLLANCGLSIAKLKGNQGYVVLNYQGEAVFETVWDRVSGHKDYAGCFTVYTSPMRHLSLSQNNLNIDSNYMGDANFSSVCGGKLEQQLLHMSRILILFKGEITSESKGLSVPSL
ncbi:MAG: hypothetical protein U5N86_11990 [Planctomycetota bacterium]|nr:hypothetical protein [Planctomycetota bacterium]